MDLLASFGPFIAGMFAGLFFMQFLNRWFRTIAEALGQHFPDVPAPTKSERRTAWILAFVNPVPWLVFIGVPYGVYRASTHGLSEGWFWFWAGSIFLIVGMYSYIAYVVLRQRSRDEKEEA